MRRLALLLLAVVLACGTAAAWQTDILYYADGSDNPHTITSSGGIQYPGLWISNATIASGLDDVGVRAAPAVFEKGGTWYVVSGNYTGQFTGYNWTGSTWQSDPAIASGLDDVGERATPAVFEKGGTWYVVSGNNTGQFTGYNWTGSTWQSDPAIASGLDDVGERAAPAVFEKGGTWYVVSGNYTGQFTGYNWTGSTWQSDPAIASGLGKVGYLSAPTVFEKGGTWYVVSGNYTGQFTGYNWTGSTWQSDPAIASGLGKVSLYTTPAAFEKGGTWYAVSGNHAGQFTGWHAAQNTHWTAAALSSEATLNLTYYNATNLTIAAFTITSGTLDYLTATNLTAGNYYSLSPAGGDPLETQQASGTTITFTTNLPVGEYTVSKTSYTDETGVHGIVYEGTTETNAPIQAVIVTIYNTTWSDTTITDSSGYYIFTGLTNDTYILTFTKDRYVTVDYQYCTPSDEEMYSKDIWMQRDTGQFYSRHYITFCVCNIWGTRYPGVDAVCYTNGIIDATGTTGSDGSVALSLFEDVEYRLTFTNATQGISETLTLHPRDDYYYIIVGDTSTWTDHEHTLHDEIHTTVAKRIINDTHVWINVTYSDNLLQTTELDAYINETNLEDPTNETLIAHHAFAGNLNDTSHNFTVPMAGGQAYFVRLHHEHTEFGSTWFTYAVRREGMLMDLGIPLGTYIYICIILVLFVGAMFGGTTATTGAVSICVLGWLFLAFGWLQPSMGIFAPICLSVASVYAISTAIIHRQRKAGYA